jgi:hypothetical protein
MTQKAPSASPNLRRTNHPAIRSDNVIGGVSDDIGSVSFVIAMTGHCYDGARRGNVTDDG